MSQRDDASRAPFDLSNPAEFERIYEESYAYTVSVARQAADRYGLGQEAEDLAQAAWASLWQGRHTRGKAIEYPVAYVRKIIFRLAAEAAREQISTRELLARLSGTSKATMSAILDAEPDTTEHAHQPCPAPTPEQAHISREILAQLVRILRQLPRTQREAVALKADGYDGQERAELRRVRPGTDRQHLLRGRLRGRRLIKEQAPDLAWEEDK